MTDVFLLADVGLQTLRCVARACTSVIALDRTEVHFGDSYLGIEKVGAVLVRVPG